MSASAALVLTLGAWAWAQAPQPGKIDPPAAAALQRGTSEQARIVFELQTWGVPPELVVFYPDPRGDSGQQSPAPDPHPPKPEPGPQPPNPKPEPGQPHGNVLPSANEGLFPQRRFLLYDLATLIPSSAAWRLHGALSRLSSVQLSRVTEAQFHEALRLIEQGCRRESDPTYEAYPEVFQAYYNQAVETLADRGGRGAALGLSRPARLLREVLLQQRARLLGRLQLLGRSGGSTQELRGLKSTLLALDHLSGVKPGLLTHAALHTMVSEIPREALTPSQWDALARAFPMGESIVRLGMMELWREGATGRGVRVAVIDTGVDSSHPDLAGFVCDRRNFTRHRYRAGPLRGQPDPRGSHGTHVSGIIHALAPEAQICNYKALDEEVSGQMPPEFVFNNRQAARAVADAMELAASEAEQDGLRLVINLSLGFERRNHLVASDEVRDKVAELSGRGVIVVVSSGNEGEGSVRNPAFDTSALTTGNVCYSGRQNPSSSRAEVFECLQDGEGRLVLKPDIMAYGTEVRSAQYSTTFGWIQGTEYVEMTGTSMAAPHVTAVVAIMLQVAGDRHLEIDYDEVREFLVATASEAPDAPYGRGIVNPRGACQRIEMVSNLVLVRPACSLARGGR